MKVLILSSNDIQGGAAKAAYRLHKGLQLHNIDSTMLVQFKLSSDPTVLSVDKSKNFFYSRLRRYLNKLPSKFFKQHNNGLCNISWLKNTYTIKKIKEINPDIVHLHWFNSGLLSVSDLEKLNFKIVYTFHDMWAFSAGGHVDQRFDIDRNIECVSSYSLLERFNLWYKSKYFKKILSLSLICPSNWMYRCSKNSQVTGSFDTVVIPNLLDTNIFVPRANEVLKKEYKLKNNDKVILFGAMNADVDPNKGLTLLLKALDILSPSYTVILYGSSTNINIQVKQKLIILPNIFYENDIIDLYNLADVMVVPSLYENLSNTIIESMSCGTPVVCFDVGGNLDIIEHKINGFVATRYCPESLGDGINWVIENNSNLDLSINARKSVTEKFSQKVVVSKHIDLYKKLHN